MLGSSKEMDKSEEALKTIGEVSEHLQIEPHVLRFWENKFKQIKPQKRRGRRYYRPEDVALIKEIQALLRDQGYTIKGAQKHLSTRKKNAKESTSLSSQVRPSNLNETIQCQPSLFPDIPPYFVVPKNAKAVPAHASDNAVASSNPTKESKTYVSVIEKRKLAEIYRGLCYTQEHLDEVLSSNT